MLKLKFAMLTLLATTACGKTDKAEKGETASKVADGEKDKAEAFFFEQTQKEVNEIKGLLAKGEVPSTSACATRTYGERLTSDDGKKLAAELDGLCNFDIPIAAARLALADAEKARVAKPDEKVLGECYNAHWTTAMTTLKEKAADRPEVAELESKWAQACPK